MEYYQTKLESFSIEDKLIQIISLKDKHQYYDPEKKAEKLGISSSAWPIFGLVWPASVVLAKIVEGMDLQELRILEVGCGIGLASLVAASKNADITASDYHPLAESFLKKNSDANHFDPIKYLTGDWNHPITNAGKFDLIIGSDLLYEDNYSELLSRFIDCHLSQDGTVILTDPGRRTAKKIKKSMNKLGFNHEVSKVNTDGKLQKNGYFTKYVFRRLSTS
jgi:predicted nicotinamide N-methyase